ncbi:MAG: hypothetical protein O7E49_07435 [Gemmatimonadetes bacterium]|nr:hypothetical protein [Gemmatimonadota bacterium]
MLARLLKLNHERYEEGAAQGLHHKKGRGKSGGKGRARTRGRVEASKPAEPGLFDDAIPAPKRIAAEVAESPRRATDEIARNDVIQTIRMVAGSNGELPGDDFITAVAR